MSRAIKRLNWTRKKKTIRASEQNEADRAAWREYAKTQDASKLVFIDECGSNIALTRLYARSSKGKRVYGSVPRNKRANITLLASLSLASGWEKPSFWKAQRIPPCLSFTWNRFWLRVYTLDILSSWTRSNTHTGEKVQQAIEARGCQLLFLPSYSPDLSPIEEVFSKLKAVLRRVGARTPEADAGRQLGKLFSR